MYAPATVPTPTRVAREDHYRSRQGWEGGLSFSTVFCCWCVFIFFFLRILFPSKLVHVYLYSECVMCTVTTTDFRYRTADCCCCVHLSLSGHFVEIRFVVRGSVEKHMLGCVKHLVVGITDVVHLLVIPLLPPAEEYASRPGM
jgi:hypothetical protein